MMNDGDDCDASDHHPASLSQRREVGMPVPRVLGRDRDAACARLLGRAYYGHRGSAWSLAWMAWPRAASMMMRARGCCSADW